MANVLIVTDYTGNLHIMPLGNKAYYQGKNLVNRDKQYKFRENLDEAEAIAFVEKNNGVDPDYTSPAKTVQVLADKDKQIEDLMKQLQEKNSIVAQATNLAPQLSEKDKQIQDLMAKIEAGKTAPTVEDLAAKDAKIKEMEAKFAEMQKALAAKTSTKAETAAGK